MCIGSQNSVALGVGRAQPEREELQAAVDQLPAAGAEARHVLPGGGGDGDEPPRRARQQVSTATAHPLLCCTLMVEMKHTSPRSAMPPFAFGGIIFSTLISSLAATATTTVAVPFDICSFPCSTAPSWQPASGTRRNEWKKNTANLKARPPSDVGHRQDYRTGHLHQRIHAVLDTARGVAFS
jgi:hypothetical protein